MTKYYNANELQSPSEIRIYNNRIRRLQIVRKQYFVLFAIITFVIFVTVFMKASLLTDAQSDNYTHDFKYYKTYTVHAGDTLNEIASEYYPEEHYSNFNSYLYEICTINKLKNADHLNAGENIIIPYYSSEFK